MADRELMQQARDALAGYRRELNEHQPCDAERALEARLAQPEPEPVAWLVTEDGKPVFLKGDKTPAAHVAKRKPNRKLIPLYAGAA